MPSSFLTPRFPGFLLAFFLALPTSLSPSATRLIDFAGVGLARQKQPRAVPAARLLHEHQRRVGRRLHPLPRFAGSLACPPSSPPPPPASPINTPSHHASPRPVPPSLSLPLHLIASVHVRLGLQQGRRHLQAPGPRREVQRREPLLRRAGGRAGACASAGVRTRARRGLRAWFRWEWKGRQRRDAFHPPLPHHHHQRKSLTRIQHHN